MAKKGLPIVTIAVSAVIGGLLVILAHRAGVISLKTAADQGGILPNVRHFPLSAGNLGQ